MTVGLTLASASVVRADLLKKAGLAFDIKPAQIDEGEIRSTFEYEPRTGLLRADPGDVADVLAMAKATTVSENAEGYVIGADQILAQDQRVFEKPETLDDVQNTLIALKGKTHTLYSSVCVAVDGDVIWHYGDQAHLTMRDLSAKTIGQYLSMCGDVLKNSVGAYQYEGPGVQLFSKVDGDYFTILGLPLMPLLDFLRTTDIQDSFHDIGLLM